VSISSNIAEGCGKRTDRDFISFLYNAMGSLKEVENILLIAKDLGYISQSDFLKLDNDMNNLGGKLNNFIRGREAKSNNKEVAKNA
jgi:four helix bundle protein